MVRSLDKNAYQQYITENVTNAFWKALRVKSKRQKVGLAVTDAKGNPILRTDTVIEALCQALKENI